jgi:hypothetical protein
MSMNLHLYDPVAGCNCHLYQTPTEETHRILSAGGKDAIFKAYILWAKGLWKDAKYRNWKEEVKEHEQRVRRFLNGHPNAQWGRV